MVEKKGRADVLLAPFQPTPDMSLSLVGYKLVPIPQIKVGLEAAAIILSASWPRMAPPPTPRWKKGLAQLRAKGVIERAYRESGFFNTRTQNWTRIN